MTVEELIAELQELPSKTVVLVTNYIDGGGPRFVDLENVGFCRDSVIRLTDPYGNAYYRRARSGTSEPTVEALCL